MSIRYSKKIHQSLSLSCDVEFHCSGLYKNVASTSNICNSLVLTHSVNLPGTLFLRHEEAEQLTTQSPNISVVTIPRHCGVTVYKNLGRLKRPGGGSHR